MFGLEAWEFGVVIVLFILFVIIVEELFKFIKGLIIVGAISASFPFFLHFIGIGIEINKDVLIFFVILGIGMYLLYRHFKFLWKISKFIGDLFKRKK